MIGPSRRVAFNHSAFTVLPNAQSSVFELRSVSGLASAASVALDTVQTLGANSNSYNNDLSLHSDNIKGTLFKEANSVQGVVHCQGGEGNLLDESGTSLGIDCFYEDNKEGSGSPGVQTFRQLVMTDSVTDSDSRCAGGLASAAPAAVMALSYDGKPVEEHSVRTSCIGSRMGCDSVNSFAATDTQTSGSFDLLHTNSGVRRGLSCAGGPVSAASVTLSDGQSMCDVSSTSRPRSGACGVSSASNELDAAQTCINGRTRDSDGTGIFDVADSSTDGDLRFAAGSASAGSDLQMVNDSCTDRIAVNGTDGDETASANLQPISSPGFHHSSHLSNPNNNHPHTDINRLGAEKGEENHFSASVNDFPSQILMITWNMDRA